MKTRQEFKGTDAEYDIYVSEQSKGKTATSNKLQEEKVTPETVVIEGCVSAVDHVNPTSGKNYHLVTLGKDTVLVDDLRFKGHGQFYQVGAHISITCDRKVAFKTGYEDVDGQWKLHKSGGLTAVKVTYSEQTTARKAENLAKKDSLEVVNDAKTGAIEKVMSLIKTQLQDSDNPEALATAFAGAFAALK